MLVINLPKCCVLGVNMTEEELKSLIENIINSLKEEGFEAIPCKAPLAQRNNFESNQKDQITDSTIKMAIIKTREQSNKLS